MQGRLANQDLYEAEKNRPLTRWERKKKRIFGDAGTMTRTFFAGALMGGAMGSCIGGILGIPLAIKYRQFSLIPLSMGSSGCSFAFLLGVGSIIRSGEMAHDDAETYEI